MLRNMSHYIPGTVSATSLKGQPVYRLTVDVGKTCLQVVQPCRRHHTGPYSCTDEWYPKQVGDVLQGRSHLPAWEVERVRLWPPSVNERGQEGPVELKP